MLKNVYLTPNGYRILQEKIDKLINIDLIELSKEINNSLKEGNLSENPSYISAMNKAKMLEKKLKTLKIKFSLATVIDNKGYKGKDIDLGALVILQDLESLKEITYKITCEEEASWEDERKKTNQCISISSPLGKALYKHLEEDEIDIILPKSKEKSFKILKVEY